MHLLLDAVLSGGIMPFYPFFTFSFGLNLIGFFPLAWQSTIIPTLDAILLVLWMVYLEITHKISKFI
jgi:hypothetical protein